MKYYIFLFLSVISIASASTSLPKEFETVECSYCGRWLFSIFNFQKSNIGSEYDW